jgi:hypothetical protein
MRLERTRQEFRKILKYQIHKNQSSGSRVVQWGPTDSYYEEHVQTTVLFKEQNKIHFSATFIGDSDKLSLCRHSPRYRDTYFMPFAFPVRIIQVTILIIKKFHASWYVRRFLSAALDYDRYELVSGQPVRFRQHE